MTDLLGGSIKQGDTYYLTLTLSSGSLTGSTVRFVAKRKITDTDASAVITKVSTSVSQIEILTSTTAKITILPADTASLDIKSSLTLYYDVQVTTSTGVVDTVETGSFTIEKDIAVTSP